jgi:hypothetical protein
LPKSEGKGHHHSSEMTMDHQQDSPTQATPNTTPTNHDHDSDDHHHE